MKSGVRPARFLLLLGAFSRWHLALYVALVAYAAWEWSENGYSEEAVSMWLILFPIAAGTGLLASAREGKLDLLLGAGASRRRIFSAAFVRSVALPSALALPLAAVSGQITVAGEAATVLRTVAVAILTGGWCFAAGLVNPRYALGVGWIALRIVFVISRPTFAIYHQILAVRSGAPLPGTGKLLLVAFAFPEIVLRREIPASVAMTIAAAGIAAVGLAAAVFERSELGGHRSQ